MSDEKPFTSKDMIRLFLKNKRLQEENERAKEEAHKEAEEQVKNAQKKATTAKKEANSWKKKAQELEEEIRELKEEQKKRNKIIDDIRDELVALRLRLEELIEEEKKAKTKEEREKKQKEYQEKLALLENLLHDAYGKRSEKRGRGSRKQSQKKDKKRKKRRAQEIQPTETEVLRLPEEDLKCDCCGGTFKEIEGKYTDQDIIEVQKLLYKMKQWKKQHYRCQCSRTKVAKGPELQLIDNGRYDVSFAIEVAVAKYLFHFPLERQVKAMKLDGLYVTSQTLWDQIFALAMLLRPIYEKIHDYLLCQKYFHSDFTSWYLVGKQSKNGKRKRMELMVINNHELAFFSMLAGKSRMEVASVLRDFDGTLVGDADLGYQRLEKGKERGLIIDYTEEVVDPNDPTKKIKVKRSFEVLCNFKLAGCWTHARRPFFYAERKGLNCSKILDKIGELYAAEAEYKELSGGDRKRLVEIRRNCRPKKSKKIVSEIYELKDELKSIAGKNAIGDIADGIKYLENQKTRLEVFLEDPEIEIDNNIAERILRDAVQGRKNHYQSRSMNGTLVSAIFYSLLGSCKLLKLNPVEYLQAAFVAIKKDPNHHLTPLEYQQNLPDSS